MEQMEFLNAKITVLLKYLSNFWRSLEFSLINWKLELKLNCTKYCVLYANVNDDANDNPNIIFIITNTKLYVPVVTLSTKDNKKLSERLSKGFERTVYQNEHETKRETKNITNKYRYFLESNFVRVNRLFVLIYLNRNNDVKQCNARKYYLSKGIIKA